MNSKLTLKSLDQSELGAPAAELEAFQGGAYQRCIGLYNDDGQLVTIYCTNGLSWYY